MIKKKSSGIASRRMAYSKSQMGGSKFSVFEWGGDAPEFYKPLEAKNGKCSINILPYTITSKKHPLVVKKICEVGDQDYGFDYYCHSGVGVENKTVLCPVTFDKPCPICELSRSMGETKEGKALARRHRVSYNIEDLKDGGKFKVFDVPFFSFEKELVNSAEGYFDDGSSVDFADAGEDGYSVKFRTQKVTRGGMTFAEFKNIDFEERESPVDSDNLEKVIDFDKHLKTYTYEELEKMVMVGGDSHDEDDDVVDEDEEPEEEEKPKRKAKAKSDDDEDEEPEEEEKPKRKAKGKSDDDEDDEPEEEDVKKKRRRRREEEDD